MPPSADRPAQLPAWTTWRWSTRRWSSRIIAPSSTATWWPSDAELARSSPLHTGRSRTVLEYAAPTGRLVTVAKAPGFTEADWAPLADLVDTANFLRVGAFKEEMDWAGYLGFLTGLGHHPPDWECTFKRITEHGELVFLELEERNSWSAISWCVELAAGLPVRRHDGRIRRLDLYLQVALRRDRRHRGWHRWRPINGASPSTPIRRALLGLPADKVPRAGSGEPTTH